MRDYARSMLPPATHHHDDCGADCRGRGWCGSQVCDGVDRATRRAPGRCARCRRDARNHEGGMQL